MFGLHERFQHGMNYLTSQILIKRENQFRRLGMDEPGGEHLREQFEQLQTQTLNDAENALRSASQLNDIHTRVTSHLHDIPTRVTEAVVGRVLSHQTPGRIINEAIRVNNASKNVAAKIANFETNAKHRIDTTSRNAAAALGQRFRGATPAPKPPASNTTRSTAAGPSGTRGTSGAAGHSGAGGTSAASATRGRGRGVQRVNPAAVQAQLTRLNGLRNQHKESIERLNRLEQRLTQTGSGAAINSTGNSVGRLVKDQQRINDELGQVTQGTQRYVDRVSKLDTASSRFFI